MVFPLFIFGWVAEWSCSGLQIRVRRFDSDPSLQFLSALHPNLVYRYNRGANRPLRYARVAKLVDARDLSKLST